MNELKYSVVRYKGHLTYAVWVPDSEQDGFVEGFGAEISILRPGTDFIYPTDYPLDIGWDKVYTSKIFINQIGEISGQGPDKSNTAPLFNIHYSLPVVFRAYSHIEYRALFTILMALVLVDSKNIFGIEGRPSSDLTPEMLNFLERTNIPWGNKKPIIYKNSKISDIYDAKNWKVRLEKDKISDIDPNVVLQAKNQFKERIFYKKYKRKMELVSFEQLEIDWPL